MEEEIKNKIMAEWQNDYFLSLGIYQHLVECKQKFEMTKNHAVLPMSKEALQYELDKELADLKLLLDLYVKDEMVKERLNKYLKEKEK